MNPGTIDRQLLTDTVARDSRHSVAEGSFPRIVPSIAILLCVLGLCGVCSMHAQDSEDDVPPLDSLTAAVRSESPARALDVISVGGETTISPGSGDFFQNYRTLGGDVDALAPYFSPSLTGRFALGRFFRLAFYGSWAHSGFVELYNVERPRPGDTLGRGDAIASIIDDVSLQAFPLLAGIEFSPIESQFSSYLGAMGGIAVVSGDWTSTVRSLAPGEFYRPTNNLHSLLLAPAARFYTGVDLRFDRYLFGTTAVRGIFFEAAFVVLPVNMPFFNEIRHQARGLPLVPASDDATLGMGGFTVTLGVNLQFHRR